MRRWVWPVALPVIAVTLFGCLGGLLATLLMPTTYRAEAYVVVYEMPPGFRELIGPDEANQIQSIYQAGALQDAVVSQVIQQMPDLTPERIRSSVQVSIVAYTPLTRVAATAPSPDQAVAVANEVATAWARQVLHTNNTAYTIVSDQLTSREQAIDRQINAALAAIKAVGAPTAATQNYVSGLQSQLSAELQEKTNVDNALNQLATYRLQVIGNGYVAIPGNTRQVTVSPDPIKEIGGGTAIGFALGVILALWLMRPRIVSRIADAAVAPATPPKGTG